MQYAWLIWSLSFLILWLVIFIFKRPYGKEMVRISLWTTLFGLTEPLFVPNYWNPPSLFNLAQKTRFDIESIIFTFAIGGIASVLYKIVFKMGNQPLEFTVRSNQKHKLHFYSLLTPIVVFLLLAMLTNLNHIYCGILALLAGTLAAIFCRPDLKTKIWVGGILFLLLYFIFFKSLIIAYPGYVKVVWDFTSVSPVLIFGVPFTELLWGFAFGMFWSSLYEHLLWYKLLLNIKSQNAYQ